MCQGLCPCLLLFPLVYSSNTKWFLLLAREQFSLWFLFSEQQSFFHFLPHRFPSNHTWNCVSPCSNGTTPEGPETQSMLNVLRVVHFLAAPTLRQLIFHSPEVWQFLVFLDTHCSEAVLKNILYFKVQINVSLVSLSGPTHKDCGLVYNCNKSIGSNSCWPYRSIPAALSNITTGRNPCWRNHSALWQKEECSVAKQLFFMQLLMEVWEVEPKLQATGGFSRLLQACSSLVPSTRTHKDRQLLSYTAFPQWSFFLTWE